MALPFLHSTFNLIKVSVEKHVGLKTHGVIQMTAELERATTSSLVAAYSEAAFAHGESTANGDHRTANRNHDELAAIYRELRRRGHADQHELLRLLAADSIHVRGWAAAHALEFAATEGERVLEEIAASAIGTPQLNAKMTLSEWRKGTLRFP